MRRLIGASVCVAGALLASTSALANPQVNAPAGNVAGERRGQADVFWSIPYATAPTGERRWRPPEPAPVWTETRNATRPGPQCPQSMSADQVALWGEWQQSEDCLSLTIWRPAGARAGARLPVMFWIHGGNFRSGSGAWPFYDGTALVRRGVILVSINYRLGVLGRFAHPALLREQPDAPVANYALMDQVAALRWVRENIAAFGGDPARVTIFGYSAGGVSANYLLALPSARGLFSGVIAQSGGVQIGGDRQLAQRRAGPLGEPLVEEGARLAQSFAISDGADAMARLRALTPDQLIGWQDRNIIGSLNPVVDGRLVPDELARLFARGAIARVPYLAGTTSWEASLLAYTARPVPPAIILSAVPDRAALERLYATQEDQQLAHAWFADGTFAAPQHMLTRMAAAAGNPSWLYLFDHVPAAIRSTVPGTAHGDEVAYVFGTLPGKMRGVTASQLSRQDWHVAALMADAWTRFARRGDPAVRSGALRRWARWAPGTDTTMVLGARPRAVAGHRRAIIDYYEAIFAARLTANPPAAPTSAN